MSSFVVLFADFYTKSDHIHVFAVIIVIYFSPSLSFSQMMRIFSPSNNYMEKNVIYHSDIEFCSVDVFYVICIKF